MTREAPPPKRLVLAVDDSATELAFLHPALSGHFEVTTVLSPTQALELLASHSFHVVCSDYEMPGMNEIDFLGLVRNMESPPSCLLITAVTNMKGRVLDGVAGVVIKPYDPETLVQRMRRLAELAETSRDVPACGESPGSKERCDACFCGGRFDEKVIDVGPVRRCGEALLRFRRQPLTGLGEPEVVMPFASIAPRIIRALEAAACSSRGAVPYSRTTRTHPGRPALSREA